MRITEVEQLLTKHRVLFLLSTAALVYLAFIGLREVWYPDEPDIAEVARAMFVSGDWVSPRRMGVIWVDYPPMIYWMGTISSHVFGEMTAFSLRLPNALAAIITILLTAGVARSWFGEKAGLWAGFALLTFLMFVYEGNSYRPDVMFTLTILAGMVSYVAGGEGSGNVSLRAAAFVFFGLAMLSKGPLGLLLPGLVLVVWLAIQHKWWRIVELAPLALVALLVYALWFLSNAQAMGWESMFGEFYAQNFERFLTSENRGHGQPWYYYIRNFWIDFAPWSWLFPPAVWWIYRTEKWRDPKIMLALLWFVIFVAFLSLAATKRQLYLLPAYPAVALLLGVWLAEVGNPDGDGQSSVGKLAVRVYSWALVLVFISLGAYVLWAVPNLESLLAGRELTSQEIEIFASVGMPLTVLGIALVMSAMVIGAAWKFGGSRMALLGIGGSHVLIYVVILALVLPTLEPAKTYKPQSEWISAEIGDEPRFGMVDVAGVGRRGGFSYYTGTAVDLLEGPEEVADYLRKYPKTIVLVKANQYEQDFLNGFDHPDFRLLSDVRVGRHLFRVLARVKAADE
jgi:4-amino-4-deoxy-L-arabinose transferase-like glycosyltransferase